MRLVLLDVGDRKALLAPVGAWTVWRADGREAVDLLQRLSTQDLRPLLAGHGATTLLLSPLGRMLHRIHAVADGRGLVLLAEPAPSSPPLGEWIERYTFAEDARVAPSPDLAALRLAGHGTRELLRLATGLELDPAGAALEAQGLRWSATRAGALPAAWAVGSAAAVAEARAALERAGAAPCDEPRWRTVRAAARAPEGGAEIGPEWHPLEAGLADDISFTKGCYTGQEVVARQDAQQRIPRALVTLAFDEAPAAGDALVSEERDGCVVTTVAAEACDGGWLALGYVRSRNAKAGHEARTARGLAGRVIDPPLG